MITERVQKILHSYATAKTGPGECFGRGIVVGYCDAPQVCIRQEDGTQFWWRADLCTFEPEGERDATQEGVLQEDDQS